MSCQYEILFLSDLLKKSRQKTHPDFALALDFIFARLDGLTKNLPNSKFNKIIVWVKKLVPRSLLPVLFYRFRYDCMMGFRQQEQREIMGMISFQKHPAKEMIGMFDIYMAPHRRHKDLVSNFITMAEMVYDLTQKFKNQGYEYLQCGDNKITRKFLRRYQKVLDDKNLEAKVDIENTRIYL